MNELIEYNTCLICLQTIIKNEDILTCCNTYYHKKCIKKWTQNNNTCPHCRAIINNTENISIDIISNTSDIISNTSDNIEAFQSNFIIFGLKKCCIILFIIFEIVIISIAVILLLIYLIQRY